MNPQAQSLTFAVTLLLLLLIKIEGNSMPKGLHENVTDVSSPPPSPQENDENQSGCRSRPWICSRGEFPPSSLCCRNRCVDVASDINNCGLCGIRCRFNWRCCNRLCMNTNVNPLNCGRCGRACPIGTLCLFGLCAYAQPQPPVFPPEQNPPQSQPPIFPPEQNAPQPQPQQPESPIQPPAIE